MSRLVSLTFPRFIQASCVQRICQARRFYAPVALSKLRVPELDWCICEKKIGVVPQSLEILLKKRAQYKQLLKSPLIDPKIKQVYEARQGSLKWILVTSFGYLGYSNSKFGNIDAHIAT